MSRSEFDESGDETPVDGEGSFADSETVRPDRPAPEASGGDEDDTGTVVVDRVVDDQEMTDAGAPELGRRRIGRYRIVKELARGGQATVYLAIDEQLDRQVAIKVLQGGGLEQPLLLKRFQREAAIVSQLDDPGICSIHDAGVSDGFAYIAMQYVRGATLAHWLKERWADLKEPESSASESSGSRSGQRRSGRSTPIRSIVEDVLVILESVARSLQVAHDAGVVHRDIKAANIMMTEDDRPVIVDFGLARAAELQMETLTISGDLFGTPLYMSPEQVEGQPLDNRSDVYSLGVVLFEGVTGERPFKAPTRDGLYRSILHEDAPDIRSIRPELPQDLAIVVATALEKDRNRRYQSAADLADDLRRIRRNEVIRAKPLSAWFRFRRLCQRNPLASALVALLFVVLMVGLGLTVAKNLELERQRLRSEWATYAAQIGAAVAAEHAADSQGMTKALGRTSPELRGWEWRYLASRAETQLFSLPAPGLNDPFAQAVKNDDRFVWLYDNKRPAVLIDAEKGEVVRTIEPPLPYTSLGVSPDGSRLLMVAESVGTPPHADRIVMLDAVTGEEIWRRDDSCRMAVLNVFSPDGARFVIGTHYGIAIHDSDTGELLRRIELAERTFFYYPQYLTDGLAVVNYPSAAGTDSTLFVIDIETGERTWAAPEKIEITHFSVDQDEHRIYFVETLDSMQGALGKAQSSADAVAIYDLDDEKYLLRGLPFDDRSGMIGEDLIGSVVPGSLELRDIRSGQIAGRALGPCLHGHVTGACGGRRAVAHLKDGRALVWSTEIASSPWVASQNSKQPTTLSPSGEVVVSGNWGSITASRALDGTLLYEKSIGRADIAVISFSPAGDRMAVADLSGVLVVMATEDGRTLARWQRPLPDRRGLRHVVWSSDGQSLFLGDTKEQLWQLELEAQEARLVAELERPITALIAEAGGLRLLAGLGAANKSESEADDGLLLALQIADGREVARRELPAPVTTLCEVAGDLPGASTEKGSVLCGDSRGGVHELEPESLDLLRTIELGDSAIRSLQWSPEIDRLVVATREGVVLCEYLNGIELMVLQLSEVGFARFLPAREAIFFTQTVQFRPYGFFEIAPDEELSHRRNLNSRAFLEITGRRRRLRSLEGTRAEIAQAAFEPDLREVLDRRLAASSEIAADLNSDAWGLVLHPGGTEDDYRRGLEKARAAIAILPDDWGITNTLSLALLRNGLHEDCLRNIDGGLPRYHELGFSGMNPHDRLMRAIALHHLGRHEEARPDFEQAKEEVDPNDSEALIVLVEAEALLAPR